MSDWWQLKGKLLGVDMTPRGCKKKYDAATLRSIREGVVPAGMSVQGCRYVARTRSVIEFRCQDTNRERRWRERALMVRALKDSGMRVKDIAARLEFRINVCQRAAQEGGRIRLKPWDRVKGRI